MSEPETDAPKRFRYEHMVVLVDEDGEECIQTCEDQDPLNPAWRAPHILSFSFFDLGYWLLSGGATRSYVAFTVGGFRLRRFNESPVYYVGKVVTVEEATQGITDPAVIEGIAGCSRPGDNRLIWYPTGLIVPYDEGDIVIEPLPVSWPDELPAVS